MSEDWSYYIDQFWDDHSNPLFNHLFPGGPWKHLVVMIAYLVFVLKLGPKMMKGREPFQMNTIIQTYNVINILLNIYGFVYFMVPTKGSTVCFQCKYVANEEEMAILPPGIHLYVFLKVFHS